MDGTPKAQVCSEAGFFFSAAVVATPFHMLLLTVETADAAATVDAAKLWLQTESEN